MFNLLRNIKDIYKFNKYIIKIKDTWIDHSNKKYFNIYNLKHYYNLYKMYKNDDKKFLKTLLKRDIKTFYSRDFILLNSILLKLLNKYIDDKEVLELYIRRFRDQEGTPDNKYTYIEYRNNADIIKLFKDTILSLINNDELSDKVYKCINTYKSHETPYKIRATTDYAGYINYESEYYTFINEGIDLSKYCNKDIYKVEANSKMLDMYINQTNDIDILDDIKSDSERSLFKTIYFKMA